MPLQKEGIPSPGNNQNSAYQCSRPVCAYSNDGNRRYGIVALVQIMDTYHNPVYVFSFLSFCIEPDIR